MLITPTIEKLQALSLGGMARALAEQLGRPDYAGLSFEERLGLLVDREAQDRENRRLARHLKAARLRSDAVIEDLDLRAPRGLDRATVLALAESHWVAAHRNVLVTGPTGVGKTFLACALAHAAIRRGHTALYLRLPRLLDELVLARADGRLPRLMAAWARVDVLVLDDLGLQPVAPARAADLLEVIEDRAGLRSTVVTSQLRWATGTRPSESPRSPMPSSTGSSMLPTGSSSRAPRCDGPTGPLRSPGAPIGPPRRRRPRDRPRQPAQDGRRTVEPIPDTPRRSHQQPPRRLCQTTQPTTRGGDHQGLRPSPRVGRSAASDGGDRKPRNG